MRSQVNGLDGARVLTDLRALADATSDGRGAQRVCWTPVWAAARKRLCEQLAELPVEVHVDAAGNLWATLVGRSSRAVVVGSHLDSVPDGGRLDGALGVYASLAILRRLCGEGEPAATVRLVDWADEEGARFAYSMLGSSAACGVLDIGPLRVARDTDGIPLTEALDSHGVDIERMSESARELRDVAAYLELHIEQGPQLEAAGRALGVVTGVVGIEEWRIRFDPVGPRSDPLAAASGLVLAIRERAIAERGVATVGLLSVLDGGAVELLFDQRHAESPALDRMHRHARAAADRLATAEGSTVAWDTIWTSPPIAFDSGLVRLAGEAAAAVAGPTPRLASGALHDAAVLAAAGIPAAMLFVRSLGGVSHSPEEDTDDEALLLAVSALDMLVDDVLQRVADRSTRQ
jgi:hydantoinase/carbamoylase family amidase